MYVTEWVLVGFFFLLLSVHILHVFSGDEGVPESPPTLEQFKQQMNSYEKVHKEVEKFEVRGQMGNGRSQDWSEAVQEKVICCSI